MLIKKTCTEHGRTEPGDFDVLLGTGFRLPGDRLVFGQRRPEALMGGTPRGCAVDRYFL